LGAVTEDLGQREERYVSDADPEELGQAARVLTVLREQASEWLGEQQDRDRHDGGCQ
jgi:hypothetical protein